ncbi:MAG: hypothetical protein DRH17_00905 [Deltaproteobacteria bacterium]|nr:MAG: hypothetical protein DRH17_00905 [Deltaproteobacteria bacterium]
MISIFTFTLGRELYLKRLIESIQKLGGDADFEHHICFQGVKPSESMRSYLQTLSESYPLTLHLWDQNYGTGEGINRIIPYLKGELVIKLDEDAIVRSPNFFSHINAIHELVPNAVFSPYPVGLIDNPGGNVGGQKPRLGHFVRYSHKMDTYYTFRRTHHVGGFARIAPAEIVRNFQWPNDLNQGPSGCEDANFSRFCREATIPMLYLENALIVEHQESTLGQSHRYKKKVSQPRPLSLNNAQSNNKPMISVVITTYNRKEKLKRALESVINQTFPHWEIILVDDHSTDGTEDMVKDYMERLGERITYLRRNENYGQDARPKNEGTLAARAELIAYLDDDNAFRKDHLQVLWEAMEKHSDTDCVYGMRMLKDEAGQLPDRPGISSPFIPRKLQFRNYIDTSDVLCRKKAILDVGGWDETLPKHIDWNLWVRMAKANKMFIQVPKVITDYYLHSEMKQLKVQYEKDPETGREKPGFDPTRCTIWPEKTIIGDEPRLKITVFTLTYDRLDYTKETFKTMKELSGYEFDHFVVDNGSTDGTIEWLQNKYKPYKLILNDQNVGISMGSNQALEAIGDDYDIIVKVDNDCAFLTENWLQRIGEIYRRTRRIVCSPFVEKMGDDLGGIPKELIEPLKSCNLGQIGDEEIRVEEHLPGICIAAPKEAYKNFRWRDKDFFHGIQDLEFSKHCLKSGFFLCRLEDIRVEHLGSTTTQARKYPEYIDRLKRKKITRYVESNENGHKNFVIDYDDFTIGSAFKNLLRIKEHYPAFKVTAFTIPMNISVLKNELPFERLKEWAKIVSRHDWIEIAVHGYAHIPKECMVDRENAEKLISDSEKVLTDLGFNWVKVFKAPHWLSSKEMYECLRDRGYIVAVDRNQPKPWIEGLKIYIYNWSLDETALPRGEWIKGHGHFYGTPNDIQLTMPNFFANVPSTSKFYTITEYEERKKRKTKNT